MAQRFKQPDVIDAIKATRGLVTLAARKLNCSRETVYNYAKRYPKVKAAIDEERSYVVDTAELALMNAVQAKEPWAVCFTLKCLGKDRGYTERHEHTGKDGGPLESTVIILPDNGSLYGDKTSDA